MTILNYLSITQQYPLAIILNNQNVLYYNMSTTLKWTLAEVVSFAKWDKERKEGKLGIPVRFETVNELESWLHEQK